MIAIGSFADAKILITGASGYLGTALSIKLRKSGAEIYTADIDDLKFPIPKHTNHWRVDLTDPMAVKSVLTETQPDFILHLAGKVGTYNPPCNYQISEPLLRCVAENFDNCKVISIGSAAEYGEPLTPATPIYETDACKPFSQYGIDKLKVTELCTELSKQGAKIIVARPFNIIGPGIPSHLVLGKFIANLKQPTISVIQMGNLSAIRDFISVSDTIAALALLLEKGESGQVYNICSGQALSVRDLLLDFAKTAKRSVKIDEQGEHIGVECVFGSHEKITGATGWKPSPINQCYDELIHSELEGL